MRNKINKKEQIVSEDNSITEDDFLKLTRRNIINVLELWSSKDEQNDYQKNVPHIQVTVELFGQWDDFYESGAEAIIEAFSTDELLLLESFDKEINCRANKTNIQHLQLDDYMLTEEWKVLNLMAKDILKKIKIKYGL